MRLLTLGKVGVPDFCPTNVVTAGLLAEENGWQVRASYTTIPDRNITLRFSKANYPSIWAAWRDGRFWRAYAKNAQRLSFVDLKEVLADPSLLIPDDPEWPFGKPVES